MEVALAGRLVQLMIVRVAIKNLFEPCRRFLESQLAEGLFLLAEISAETSHLASSFLGAHRWQCRTLTAIVGLLQLHLRLLLVLPPRLGSPL